MRFLSCLLVLLAVTNVTSATLLHALPTHSGGYGSSNVLENIGFRFFLTEDLIWNPDLPSIGELYIRLGDGEVGNYDFNSLNAPNFDELVLHLTDDVNHWVWAGGGGGYTPETEQALGIGHPNDEIEFIRLVVPRIERVIRYDDPYPGPFTTFYFDYGWEIHGTHIPEPSSLVLMLLSGLILVGRG